MRLSKALRRKIREVDTSQPDPGIVELAGQVIRAGGIVLSPTDTVYGLACDPYSSTAVERLLTLKKRAASKGLLLLLPNAKRAVTIAQELPPQFPAITENLWPGPLTILLKARPDLHPAIRGDQGKIGCRVPDNAFLAAWLQQLDQPLVSTSANLSGQPVPGNPRELLSLFGDHVDLFLKGSSPPGSRPSTVLDLTLSKPAIVRRGENWEAVFKLLDCPNSYTD